MCKGGKRAGNVYEAIIIITIQIIININRRKIYIRNMKLKYK